MRVAGCVGFGARALDDSLPKYLNSPQTLIFDKSSSLYGIDFARPAIRKENLAVVVEGYMDVIVAHQYGFSNVVASLGTALTEKQVGIVEEAHQPPRPGPGRRRRRRDGDAEGNRGGQPHLRPEGGAAADAGGPGQV